MNFSKIFNVAKREYLFNMRRKAFLAMILIFPLFMLFIFGIQTYGASQLETKGQHFAIVDESGKGIVVEDEYTSKQSALADLTSGKIDSVYIIEPSFFENGSVTTISRKGEIFAGNSKAFESEVQKALLSNVDKKTAERILEEPKYNTLQIDENGNLIAPNYIQIGLTTGIASILIFCIFMNSSLLLRSVTEEKENRVIEIILSSISSFELLAGKIIGSAALLLTQVIFYVLVAVGLIYFAGQLSILSSFSISSLIIIVLYFIGSFLLTGAFLVGIGAISPQSREGQQISSIVILPSIFPLWFLSLIMAEPNGIVARILSLFPLSSPLGMIIRSALTDVPSIEIAISLILLYVSAFVVIWGVAKIFRAGALLSGKRPDIAEILRMLKEA